LIIEFAPEKPCAAQKPKQQQSKEFIQPLDALSENTIKNLHHFF
jgi:hypothetical protein